MQSIIQFLLIISISALYLNCQTASYKVVKHPENLNRNNNDDDIYVKKIDSSAFFYNSDRYLVNNNDIEGYGIDVSDLDFNYNEFKNYEDSTIIEIKFNEISWLGAWEYQRDAEGLSRFATYIEFLGPSAISFEYRYKQPYSVRLGLGFGKLPTKFLSRNNIKLQIIFATFNRLIGKGKYLWEIGGGLGAGKIEHEVYATILDEESPLLYVDKYPMPYIILNTAFRYQPVRGGGLLRLGFSGIVYKQDKIGSIWTPTISLGYSF